MIIKYCGSHKGQWYKILAVGGTGYYQIEVGNNLQWEQYLSYEEVLISLLRFLEG